MMINTTFSSTAKSVRNGKAISYVVFADGVEIGSRTTSKGTGFRAAIVSRKSYAHAVQVATEGIKFLTAEVAKYQRYLDNPQAAAASRNGQWIVSQIQDGTVAKWIVSCREKIQAHQDRLAALADMTQESPEFCVWSVYGFSNTGKLPGKEWNHDERLVALVQPES